MRAVIVRENMRIPIGRQGENDAVRIVWPGVIESYGKLYGEGIFSLIALRPGDSAPYPVSVTKDGADLVWVISSADTAKDGFGSAELTYTVGGVVAKSQTWGTIVNTSLSGQEPTDPPEPQKNWVDKVLTAGAAAENSANIAANAAQNAVNAAAGAESAKTAAESAQDTAGTSAAAAAGSAAAAQEKAAEAARSAAAAAEAAAATANQPINQITGASVGQTIKVKAVDADGKPTSWEAVDMPGVEEWELIEVIPLTAGVTLYDIANFSVYRKIAISIAKPITKDGSGAISLKLFKLSNANLGVASYSLDSGFFTNAYGYVELVKDEPFLRFLQLHRNNNATPGTGGASVPKDNLDLTDIGTVKIALPESYSQNFDGTGTMTIRGMR